MPTIRICCVLICLAFGTTPAWADDLSKIDRSIAREPAYQTKAPKYGLLVFGPKAAERVWLVWDGDALYVDRNGNGDLTEPGEKVAAKTVEGRDPAEYGYTFEAGDLSVGGKIHKGLSVAFFPLSLHGALPADKYAPIHAALKADPKAAAADIGLDVDSARLKGGGIGGRVSYGAGRFDPNGVLQFAASPADAPIVHFDGPLQITFQGWWQTLRLQRQNEVMLVVGTPGRGPGTLARLAYEDTIPKDLYPQIEIAWPAAEKGAAPVKERYELKERC